MNFGFLGRFDAANQIISPSPKYLNKGKQYAVNIFPRACNQHELRNVWLPSQSNGL